MIETVYVLSSLDCGREADVNIYNASVGFEARGLDVVRVSWPDVLAGKVDIQPTKPLLGGVGAVHEALTRCNVPVPPPIDYPIELRTFMGRQIHKSTMGDVRRLCNDDALDMPVFVKPYLHTKIFTGHVVQRFRDLLKSAGCPADMEVWVSDTVDFMAEYRFFVHKDRVLHVGFYKGNPTVFPNSDVVREMIRAYDSAPVSWCLDVGVTKDGRTLLVEVNDGFAFGCYGMPAQAHSIMFEDRWREMVGLPLLLLG